MTVKTKLYLTALIAAVMNILSGGFVYDRIADVFTGPEFAEVRNQVICGAAVFLASPIYHITDEFWIFMPHLDMITVSTVIATFLLGVVFAPLKKYDFDWIDYVGIWFLLWFPLKVILYLIIISQGDACVATFMGAPTWAESLGILSFIGGGVFGAKFILGKIFK